MLSITLGQRVVMSESELFMSAGIGLATNFREQIELGANLAVDQLRWVSKVIQEYGSNFAATFPSGLLPGAQILRIPTVAPNN